MKLKYKKNKVLYRYIFSDKHFVREWMNFLINCRAEFGKSENGQRLSDFSMEQLNDVKTLRDKYNNLGDTDDDLGISSLSYSVDFEKRHTINFNIFTNNPTALNYFKLHIQNVYIQLITDKSFDKYNAARDIYGLLLDEISKTLE